MNEQPNAAVTEAPNAPAPSKAKPPKAPKPKKEAKKSAPKKAAKASKKAKKGGKEPEGPAVLATYAPNYHKDTEKKTASGNTSIDCDDELAAKLRGKSLDDVYTMAAKVLAPDETLASLRAKYKHLNVGMQRMNLGNRMRGILNAKGGDKGKKK